MKNKKLLSIALVATTSAAMLAGCGSSSSSDTASSTAATEAATDAAAADTSAEQAPLLQMQVMSRLS